MKKRLPPPEAPSALERLETALNSRPAFWIFLLILIGGVLLGTARPIEDLDIWWHLKTGQWISQTGVIPKTDIFSYVIGGKPWVTFEWLSQWFFYKIWAAEGPAGLIAFRESVACLLFGLLFTFGSGAPAVSAALALFGLSFAGGSILERPQLFTYLFAMSYRALIPKALEGERRELAVAAIVLIHGLWANLHGGASVVGLLILGAHGLGRAWVKDGSGVKRLSGIVAAALALSLVNPHGYAIYTQLLGTWFDPAQRWVLEWQPLSPSTIQFRLYCVYLAMLAAACLALEGGKRATALALAGFFGAFFGFRSARNVPVAFFVTGPDLLAGASAFFQRRKKAAAWALVFAVFFIFFGWRPLSSWVRPGEVALTPSTLTREWLSGACDFIQKHGLQGRMYNDYVIGGYLIWRLAPERQVFIDGRSLEYGAVLMDRIARISRREGFVDLDSEFHFDYLVFQQRQDDRLIYLDNDPDWRCVYFDDGGLVYAHRSRANGKAASEWGYRFLRPNEQNFEYLRRYASSPSQAAAVHKELDRALRDAPPALAANAALTKSSFLMMTGDEVSWARWVDGFPGGFDYPQWRSQKAHASQILGR